MNETSPSLGPARVAALGRLEPRDRLIDISVAGDERLARLVVKQGQSVKEGEVLGYLQSYDTRLAARDRARALLHDQEKQLNANTERGQARIREAELQLSQIALIASREIEAQEARIREARANHELALLEVERHRMLLRDGVTTQQEFDRQSSQVERYRASLDSEQATLGKIIVASEANQRIAAAQITTQKSDLASIQASSQLATLREALKLAEAELAASAIRAPTDGTIIEIVANPGEAVQGRVILRMGDVSQMYALAEVYESDVSRVSLGSRVEVSSNALSAPLFGTVERIGTNVFKRQVRALDPQADVDSRVVQVRVRLEDSQEAARFVGLQVDILINTN